MSRKHSFKRRQDLYDFLEMCDATLCNCAGCFVELLSIQGRANCLAAGVPKDMEVPEAVAGRFQDRPYCRKCLLRSK